MSSAKRAIVAGVAVAVVAVAVVTLRDSEAAKIVPSTPPKVAKETEKFQRPARVEKMRASILDAIRRKPAQSIEPAPIAPKPTAVAPKVKEPPRLGVPNLGPPVEPIEGFDDEGDVEPGDPDYEEETDYSDAPLEIQAFAYVWDAVEDHVQECLRDAYGDPVPFGSMNMDVDMLVATGIGTVVEKATLLPTSSLVDTGAVECVTESLKSIAITQMQNQTGEVSFTFKFKGEQNFENPA